MDILLVVLIFMIVPGWVLKLAFIVIVGFYTFALLGTFRLMLLFLCWIAIVVAFLLIPTLREWQDLYTPGWDWTKRRKR